ncbi:MAG: tRNA guanosine(34) transglycosylase Tgt [Spirochaetales bacterium]|nr:tRNA guanosine(34) transglycosylase Tgt [Spirochaetales bacterium]
MSNSIIQIHKTSSDSKARTGEMILPHGPVETPAFMPVGTNGTVKALHHSTVNDMGYKLILGNTYHLFLRPGIDLIKEAGGLRKFTGWKHNILTDSGGFQVFSLAPFRKIKEEGVYFRSHIDGAYHTLTPEKVVRLQEGFGSDVAMVLDVCTPPEIEYREAVKALEMTTRWAARSVKEWKETDDAYEGQLFGIIQGNFFEDLRKRSAEEIISLDTPGIAIGGLSVGEPYEQFRDLLTYTAQFLPHDKPRYLMGIGTPEYILDAVENGIDIFDCVLPTRIARNGAAFTRDGNIALKKAPHINSHFPIEEDCNCHACRTYSRAYIRHLFKAKEILGPMLVSEHNLAFLYKMMEEIRESIREDRFMAYKKKFLSRYKAKK